MLFIPSCGERVRTEVLGRLTVRGCGGVSLTEDADERERVPPCSFHALTDNQPFPWQWDLYDKWFRAGKFPTNLPTGLGKTSVVAGLADRARGPRGHHAETARVRR